MKIKNQRKKTRTASSIIYISLLSYVKTNRVFKDILAVSAIISVLSSLYLMHGIAFAQTESGNSLVVAKGVSSDGSVHVTITSTQIEADQPLALQIAFTDPHGNLIPYEHYGIRAQQMDSNGMLLLSNESALAVNGKDIQVTGSLQNVSPVNFQVQLQGAGMPDTSITEWTGPNEIVDITIGQKYSYHTAVSEAPAETNQVITIPYGAYDPNYNTAAPTWYQPPFVTISVNQNVTWINQDKEIHTVTSGKSAGRAGLIGNSVGQPDGLFDSGNIDIGQSWTHKFTQAGTFEYFCTIHPWMQGFVIVQQAQPVPTDAEGHEIAKFPIVRLTQDRAYEVDLDWEPHYITTGQKITFVYQIYDNIKFLAIPAHYVFTITQNGQQLYKVDDSTQYGGAYQYFQFDNPGPVTFEFDDVAHTGQSVQYSAIVKQGNSSMSNMNMPIVEPARNLEISWWLMPLFFVPAGIAVAGIYYLKIRVKRAEKSVQTITKNNKTFEKKSPI
ncbi:MAG: hypothetical protein KGH81_07130 [Thaumarchaeota archaeon]|nr:hypothetical protein [Nitrososphaerota archaeon]